MKKHSAKWGAFEVSVSKDLGPASSRVEGVSEARQVEDFRQMAWATLRAALEKCAETEGMDIEDEETIDMIEHAMAGMRVRDE